MILMMRNYNFKLLNSVKVVYDMNKKGGKMDSFKTKSQLSVGAKSYQYYSLKEFEKNSVNIQQLPFSLKILLENLLRHEDGLSVTKEDIEALAGWSKTYSKSREIAFRPSRVLLQDFTGVPAVVDLAVMRDAMKDLGGEASKINPLLASEVRMQP